jgi:hypothetical protein
MHLNIIESTTPFNNIERYLFEEAVGLCFKRIDRFVHGSDYRNEITKFLNTGLKEQYRLLKRRGLLD